MNYLDKIKQIITEGYNFTNPNEVIEAIKSNQVGAKIDPSYKKALEFSSNLRKVFNKYFKKCAELGIKDTTYGIQLILSKTNCNSNMNDGVWYDDGSMFNLIIDSDGLYEFLKSYRKPWVKELKEYKDLMSNFTPNNLRRFEKTVQAEQVNHGNAKKGGGLIKDVKEAYNDGTWKLLIPSSFEGAKAASFYIKDGKETPTEWCTRADKNFYDRYSKNHPLYIIRNMKTGKSYQMAFTEETAWDSNRNELRVHFLDQNDVKGDEIALGDLSSIPDNLLKLIKIPSTNSLVRTMYDYKKAEGTDPNKGAKGYINTKEKKLEWGKEQILDKKYQRDVIKFLESKGHDVPEIYSEVDIVKVVSKNGYLENRSGDPLNTFSNKNIKELNDYQKKAGLRRYYLLGHPKEYVEIISWRLPSGRSDTSVNNATVFGSLRELLQYTAFLECGKEVLKTYKGQGSWGGDRIDIKSRQGEKIEKATDNAEAKIKKVIAQVNKECAADLKSIGYISFKTLEEKQPKRLSFANNKFYDYAGMPGRNITFIKNNDSYGFPPEDTYIIDKHNSFKEENIQWLPDTAEEYEVERITRKNYDSPAKRKVAWKIMQLVNKYWRKEFQNEIVQNRAEGNYKINMYEEVNYFDY